MNKKVSVLIGLSLLLFLVLGAAYSYSKYSSSISGTIVSDISKWNITVNDCDIVNPDVDNDLCFQGTILDNNKIVVNRNFNVTEFTYTNNNNKDVVDYKIAPGSSGTFKIRIKPNDTQVSIKYNLKVSLAKANDSITIYRSEPNGSSKVTIMETDGYEGILFYTPDGFYYEDGENKINTEEIVFTIYVEWDPETDNVADTEMGTSSTSPILEMPVSIEFEQYLG